MEAVAKHDFNATADDELSFRKGAVLKVSKFFLDFPARFGDILWCKKLFDLHFFTLVKKPTTTITTFFVKTL